jgi:hypothetical protein
VSLVGLPWVRLDTAFPRNPKILELIERKDHRAVLVYLCGLAYCGEHGTDGYIPRSGLVFLHGRPADAVKLVAVRLWHEDVGGWLVNDWADFQPSTEENARRRKQAQAAARKRWGT